MEESALRPYTVLAINNTSKKKEKKEKKKKSNNRIKQRREHTSHEQLVNSRCHLH